MSTFQPYLNKTLPESVQIVKTKEGADYRVNILVGASETGSETLTYLVKHASSTETPVYTAHLLSPRMLPSYVAASALYRMLAGLFLGTSPRPEAVILRTPNGELEDDMHAVTAWLKIQPSSENSLLSEPITFSHFAQLWYPYANEVIPTIPQPFVEDETEVNERLITHPQRPAKPQSERQKVLYSRFMLADQQHLQLQYLSPDSLEGLSHTDGLAKEQIGKWEQGLKEAHSKKHASPAAVQWVGSQAVTVALVELRWSKEDELFEGIGVGNYDQIIDVLEIEDNEEKIKTCLAALFHHVFVSEIRTDRLTLVNSSQNASVGEVAKDMGLIEQPGTGYTIQREDFWTNCPL